MGPSSRPLSFAFAVATRIVDLHLSLGSGKGYTAPHDTFDMTGMRCTISKKKYVFQIFVTMLPMVKSKQAPIRSNVRHHSCDLRNTIFIYLSQIRGRRLICVHSFGPANKLLVHR